MSPELWRRVKHVVGAALELEAEQRARYVEQECGSDPELRAAVNQVLEADQQAGERIEDVIAAAANDLAHSPRPGGASLEPDQEISHYRIIEKIGEGGMGVVYKAEDRLLERHVALKFLAPHMASNEVVRKRFIREAKAAASLNHPNICTVHEIDEADGVTFIAMAYLDGVDLAKRLQRGPLDIDELVDVGTQVVSGLSEAHQRSIVHRDVKPANVMLTNSGQAIVMDFGLAQLAASASRITREGATVGTSAYMSPEQTTGDELDHRTDIWAIGVVLYEMATGRLPFRGHYEEAIVYSIINEEPEPATALRGEIPRELERIVHKCLAKNPEQRYPSAADLLADLRALTRGAPVSGPSRPSSAAKQALPSIAVLPFENRGRNDEDEYFSDGVAEDVTTALSKVERLRVAPRSLAFQFKGTRPSPREVGAKLNVGHVLEGTVRRSGERLRIYVELIAIDEGYQVWSERYDRVMEDIFAIQDDISRAIVEKLKVKLASRERQLLAKRYTENLQAYNLCLRGRYYWFKRTAQAIQKAMEFYEEALTADPDYALAHSGLADCFTALGFYGVMPAREATPRSEAAALRALQLEPELAAAHASIGGAESLKWNWAAAESAFKVAIELDPSYAIAHLWYALNALLPMGRLDEALVECQRAVELDPVTPMVNLGPNLIRVINRQYELAIEDIPRALALEPNFPWGPLLLGIAHLNRGRYREAIAALSQADLPSWRDGHLGYAYAVSGETGKAIELIHELHNDSERSHLAPYHLAMIHFGLGETDAAFEHLDEACDLRTPQLFWIQALPLEQLDSVRSEARFQNILRRMNLVS